MKKPLLFFIATIVCFTIYCCSEIPENNDPILGIWAKTTTSESGVDSKQEWIFNDAYKGRYHSYTNDNVAFLTDFRWTIEGDTYTITYPETNMPSDQVKIKTTQINNSTEKTSENTSATVILEETNGETLAIRE
ncbi:hypothetical protein JM80_3109 [Cellulophaga sp. RHA_52]|uniref:hypothetical protein n=1 Tax=Cellulophaga sp. RHA_52 TaxID=1250036 RepID=UPI00119BA378|nr:hypothetical protein [Cellulophaga sp. RHA_52]TVZ10557.1 hypothetical protein JM80_3109 [Cellulophaga sp. RHA_52]